ncbi:MAG: transcription termination/antitermination protein NusA [Clostridia bacterium]|nr:transcription termination/antitermination protein NusA [Clostridia bacterium]
MNQDFILALDEIEKQKNIKKEVILETIEQALFAAYKKNYGQAQNVVVKIDREKGDIRVFQQKEVVEEVEDALCQIGIAEAQAKDARYSVGDFIDFEVTPKNFGRIAAQTAKQVVVQRIKEAERDNLFNAYSDQENQMVSGVILRRDSKNVIVKINDGDEALLPANEQLKGERYEIGSRMRFYVSEVKMMANNPEVILSRTHPGLVKRLFEQEVPEISDGSVTVKAIAREAGSRTKIAVYTEIEGLDPVGSCVGTKGARVQIICDALGGEKIDIIRYSENPAEYVAASLSPSEVSSVTADEEAKSAAVIVPAHQLSLAIGKEGQNARLAARLTGWKIDIKPDND